MTCARNSVKMTNATFTLLIEKMLSVENCRSYSNKKWQKVVCLKNTCHKCQYKYVCNQKNVLTEIQYVYNCGLWIKMQRVHEATDAVAPKVTYVSKSLRTDNERNIQQHAPLGPGNFCVYMLLILNLHHKLVNFLYSISRRLYRVVKKPNWWLMHVNRFHTEATDQFLKVAKSEFSDEIGLRQKEKNKKYDNSLTYLAQKRE